MEIPTFMMAFKNFFWQVALIYLCNDYNRIQCFFKTKKIWFFFSKLFINSIQFLDIQYQSCMFVYISTFYFATLFYAFISFKLSGWWRMWCRKQNNFCRNIFPKGIAQCGTPRLNKPHVPRYLFALCNCLYG